MYFLWENRILQSQTLVERAFTNTKETYYDSRHSIVTRANRHESLTKDEGQRLRSIGACLDDNVSRVSLVHARSFVPFGNDDDDDVDDDRSEN